jgi:DNA invertase Pin-like site-specific DNA recombinase|tara:strand:- start:3743 stop:4408 length:666 start_codon:yes stop_codon:yes gene_type:complete
MKQAVSYLRRSTRNQEGSFEIQRNFISQFAKQHDYDLIHEFKDTKSGRSNIRDGLEASIRYLTEREGIYLVLWKVDRLARNLKALGDIVEPLLPRLRFVELGDSAPNLFVISTLSVLAKAESDTISQRVKAAYETSRQNNPNHKWGNPPSLIEGREKSIETRRLKSRNHYDQVSKFVAYIDPELRKPWSKIACELNELGVRTIRGNEFTGWSLKKLHDQHT